MEVKVFNDTAHVFIVRDGVFLKPPEEFQVSYSSTIERIYPRNKKGSVFTYEFYEDTVKDWNLFLLKEGSGSSVDVVLIIPAEDNEDAREIRVYETPDNEIRHWISKPRGSSEKFGTAIPPAIKDLESFEAVKGEVSRRMQTVESLCENLESGLEQVNICRAQCNHLVQTYLNGIRKMIVTYSAVSQDQSRMWSLFESKKLRLLSSSLNSLLRSLICAEDLLQGCGEKGLQRLALVISMPPPKVGTISKFGVLIRELSWALDLIYYATSSETGLEFKWSEEKCRYVLLGMQELNLPTAEVDTSADDDTIGRDRRELLSQVLPINAESSSSVTLNFPAGFAVVVKRRLQEFATSSERTPAGVVPDCFRIDVSDLHLERCISRGTFKKIYQGEWLGQPVAVAKIKACSRDAVEKEAGFMADVQHPNIVDFFGCAIQENPTEELEDPTYADRQPSLTGFLVMELMQEDLRCLIDREAKCHSGAPFSISVSVDVLLQIVEAMMHLHKHLVIYRDLKAKNCLVSPRPKSSPQDTDVYTLKLVDFGTSKILDSQKDETGTFDVGTRRWMAPEVWAPKPRKRAVKPRWEHGKFYCPSSSCLKPTVLKEQDEPGKQLYSRSADVYSFAMTCYEITTGLMPFHGVQDRDIPYAIFQERRPLFSHPAAIACPQRLQKLMSDCWAHNPRDRPQFEDIRRELWSIKYDIEVQR